MRATWTKWLAALCAAGLLPGCHAHREQTPVADAVPAASIQLREPRAGLYTAGQPAAADWQAIRVRGVGTVIDLRAPGELKDRDEPAEVRAAGMRYIAIPVAGADDINEPNARRLHAALAAADGPVLVHCASGNRVGGLLAVMLGRMDGVPAAQALEMGRRAGMASTEGRAKQVLDAGE